MTPFAEFVSSNRSYLHKQKDGNMSNSDWPTTGETAKGMAWVAWVVGFLFVLGLVVGVIGWQVGWWFKVEDKLREDKLYDMSYGRQEALKADITKNIGEVFKITTQISQVGDDPAVTKPLEAQRLRVVSMICETAEKVNPTNPLKADQTAFVHDNCTAGAVNPSSTYNVN